MREAERTQRYIHATRTRVQGINRHTTKTATANNEQPTEKYYANVSHARSLRFDSLFSCVSCAKSCVRQWAMTVEGKYCITRYRVVYAQSTKTDRHGIGLKCSAVVAIQPSFRIEHTANGTLYFLSKIHFFFCVCCVFAKF